MSARCALSAALIALPLFGTAQLANPPAPPVSFSDFRPSRHGFAFGNSFTGSPLPIPLGAAEPRLGVPSRFGLCGGMSFAAADFFLAGKPIPVESAVPTRGQPLFSYIFSRQTDSLGPSISLGARFARWMSLPDDSAAGAHRLSAGELDAMLGALGRGEPVIIGLVLTRRPPTRELWTNHQVLAYAAKPGLPGSTISIYDPNFPHDDGVVLDLTPRIVGSQSILGFPTPVLGVDCVRRTSGGRQTPVRGIFSMPYAPKAPPRGL